MEENKVPAEILAKWLDLYRDSAKIQTEIGGIEADDGNSQTSCWLSFKRPDGVAVTVQLAARPAHPYSSLVAKLFEGDSDNIVETVGKWVDDQTGGAPRRQSSGTITIHPSPEPTPAQPRDPASQPVITATELRTSSAESPVPFGTSKRVRVLVADGELTADVLFIKYQNGEIYYGQTRDTQKFSYHVSGKHHVTGKRGVKRQEHWRTPPSLIDGHVQLITMAYDIHSLFAKALHTRQYTGKKADTVVYLDARVIPKSVFVNIMIGLIEPGRLDKLSILGESTMPAQQVTLITNTYPWLYVEVAWPSTRTN